MTIPDHPDRSTSPPSELSVVTLFTEDLADSETFAKDVLQLPLVFKDDESAVFRLGSTMINLLETRQAAPVIAPESAAAPHAGVRVTLTIAVDDVDVALTSLLERGAIHVNGPVDRPWGVRTAVIREPGGGHLWELAADLSPGPV